MIKYVSPLSPPHGHTYSCHPTLSKENMQRNNSAGYVGRLDRQREKRKRERERETGMGSQKGRGLGGWERKKAGKTRDGEESKRWEDGETDEEWQRQGGGGKERGKWRRKKGTFRHMRQKGKDEGCQRDKGK